MILKSKKIIVLAIIAAAIAVIVSGYVYQMVLKPNTAFEEKSAVIYISDAMPIAQWVASAEGSQTLANPTSFLQVAEWKKFTNTKPGRYRIKRGMNNNSIINMLRSGNQESLNLRIDDVHNIYELAGKLGKYLKVDSVGFANAFTDEAMCKKYGFNSTTIACMIAPNTYDFFWTTTPDSFLERMATIWKNYWTEEKKQKAEKLDLNPAEAVILASIVKAECSKRDEAPKIAGLYLNRLRINMPLQADPTAVFAAGLRGVNRVYEGTTNVDSPYNTYKNLGLPPGPIDFVEPIYIDAVLQPEAHAYIYMCAQPGQTGYHNFSKTYDQHLIYKDAYTDWLDKRGIR
jgi:UPF0755 protein